MKTEYSFEHFQKRREDIRKRNGRTKQTLLRLFLTTFAIVLFSFLVLATIMSPNLNIPALNDDSDSVNDVSSSDFKSRVDYRLKQIQMADGTTAPLDSQESTKSNPEEGKLQSMLSGAQKMQENMIKIDLSNLETPQIPTKTSPQQPTTIPKNDSANSQQYNQSRPKVLATQTPIQSQAPTPYIPKNSQEEVKSYKILVGNYSSPEEAQNLSDMFSANSSSSKTHIKSYNGIYCVQIGSYSDYTKAQNIANAYRSKNYKVRVVEE